LIDPIWLLRGIEGVVLVVGAGIAFVNLRAYSRTRRPSILLLGVGFIFISFAAALAGVVYELVTHDLLSAWITSSTFDAVGFLVILYSLVRPERAPDVPYSRPSSGEFRDDTRPPE
jgi:hypothetical protein